MDAYNISQTVLVYKPCEKIMQGATEKSKAQAIFPIVKPLFEGQHRIAQFSPKKTKADFSAPKRFLCGKIVQGKAQPRKKDDGDLVDRRVLFSRGNAELRNFCQRK